MGVIRVVAISAVCVSALMVAEARAQYFGRNKVEYADFEFRILSTTHFDVYHYGREEPAARLAAELAERWYSRFARALDHELTGRQPLVLYGSQPEFAQTNVVSSMLSDTVGGVTEGAKRRIAMPFAPTLAETDRILGHEIAHAFQFDISRRHGGAMGLPLWFIEGMAEYLARGPSDGDATRWIRDAVASGKIPLRERDAARQLSPYQYGHAFWAYLATRFGPEVTEKSLKPGKKRRLRDRMRHATGLEPDRLYADWRASVHATYAADPTASERAGQPLTDTSALGRIQLAPALSPDGRRAVFFSERDGFSLDLFLADVASGTIVRKLATTTASARFDSLQPLRSSGAWSPEGDTFAFPVVRQGQAALILIDMRDEHGEDREIPFKSFGQILSVAWSPDGRTLALSVLAGGFTDLYAYDLGKGRLDRLTDDPYADLHPAWSPDGRAIAFATDRFSTDLPALRFGRTELATLDVASGAVAAVADARSLGAAQVNPQWSADGRNLFFIAETGGTSNVFRLELNGRIAHQLTDVSAGVTGLTGTSPALSVASGAPVVAFTRYHHRSFELRILDGEAAIAGQQIALPSPPVEVVSGPAVHEGIPEDLLEDASELSALETMPVRPYAPQMSIERIGQPYVSSGGGPFGTFVRGGGSILFGDMLGERRLGLSLQVANRMRDVAFEARFVNRKHRWNWGVVAELEPALRRYRSAESIDFEGEAAVVKRADYLQQVQFRAAGLVAYPFNRGLRFELTAGVRHAGYHREVRSQVTSVETGRILDQSSAELSGGFPTTVGEVAAALVGDTTVFGLTGPLLGSRYRLEFAPAAGDLTFTRMLVDYRRYLMPVRPYTVALRILHAGRYGRDSNDPRLFPSFLGSRSFVRGHWRDEWECRPDPQGYCGGELIGSRIAVGNIELRAPLWGLVTHKLEYGPLPIDAFVFADGGVVWSRPEGTAFATSDRTSISSVGLGLRMNAGGLPFELIAVRTLDGPNPRWSFDFGFRTGF